MTFGASVTDGDLETLDHVAQIVIAILGFAAILAFSYQRDKDRKETAIGCISFFSKELIPAFVAFESFAGRKHLRTGAGEILPRLGEIERFSLAEVKKAGTQAFSDQMATFQGLQGLANSSETYPDYLEGNKLLTQYANTLIEFSSMVETTQAIDLDYLSEIREQFVSMVEQTATMLLYMNFFEISFTHEPTALAVVYHSWKKRVDREKGKEEEKLKEFLS
jgi:hypothetical protein